MDKEREDMITDVLDDIRLKRELIREMLKSELKIFSTNWQHRPEKSKINLRARKSYISVKKYEPHIYGISSNSCERVDCKVRVNLQHDLVSKIVKTTLGCINTSQIKGQEKGKFCCVMFWSKPSVACLFLEVIIYDFIIE